MADLADACIAPPGGFGTLVEFCEIVTSWQLRTACEIAGPKIEIADQLRPPPCLMNAPIS
jgi:predicted Rossmann-fold nucleotide-binding protein